MAESHPMKVKARPAPKVSSPRTAKKKVSAPVAESPREARNKMKLTTMATHAAVSVIASHQGAPKEAAKHPLLAKFGEKLGLGLGVIVTEALALAPKWNKPVLDAQGKPVTSIPGAERVGQHEILTRHQEVVGPKVTALVEKMRPGAIHDLLAGIGKGATEAPGASYRLEAKIADMFGK